jgi:hypothetical protein
LIEPKAEAAGFLGRSLILAALRCVYP